MGSKTNKIYVIFDDMLSLQFHCAQSRLLLLRWSFWMLFTFEVMSVLGTIGIIRAKKELHFGFSGVGQVMRDYLNWYIC